jgi:hypothetical protein
MLGNLQMLLGLSPSCHGFNIITNCLHVASPTSSKFKFPIFDSLMDFSQTHMWNFPWILVS